MSSTLELTIVFCLVALGWYIWNGQGNKEIAHRAAKRHCDELDVQLLDDTVVLQSIRPGRNRKGSLSLWRTYQFEFTSTGDERYLGKVMIAGRQVESIQLQTHRLQ